MTEQLLESPANSREIPAEEGDGPRTVVVELAPPSDGPAPADRASASGNRTAKPSRDLYNATRRSNPAAAERLARAQAAMPEVGETFLGFRLEAELGQGAFGTVFL